MADTPRSLIARLWLDTKTVLGLSPSIWFDLFRAGIELALARYRLGAHPPKELLQRARQLGQPTQAPSPQANSIAARVAFAIPRVAARGPWRSDCFIQAMAAQRWLQRKGIASTLTIGTRKDQTKGFEAHAWLTCNNQIITGGDISSYVPLVTPETVLPDGKGRAGS